MGFKSLSHIWIDDLERALRHLYDPVELRRSPLLSLLGLDTRERPVQALQERLIAAIESLRPDASVPAQANAWRFYHILNQRYIEQFTQQDIANSLALSPRQVRRLYRQALQALADVAFINCTPPISHRSSSHPTGESSDVKSDALSQASELKHMRESYPVEAADISQIIDLVVDVLNPITQQRGILFERASAADLPPIETRPTAIRHALLNVLSAMIPLMKPNGTLRLYARRSGQSIHLAMRVCLPSVDTTTHKSLSESLLVARELVALAGGTLQATDKAARDTAIDIYLPMSHEMTVLVVDDNEDALHLFERYLAGTRYRFVGTRNPRQALKMAEEMAPDIIVLDLMLPGMDGWELLGYVRQQPHIQDVPIIVCTILPQRDLALALGAADLVRKPVSRSAFLAALDRQAGPMSPRFS